MGRGWAVGALERNRYVHDSLEPASGWDGCWWIGLGRNRVAFEVPSGNGPVDAVALAMKPAPYLRRAFWLSAPVVSARLLRDGARPLPGVGQWGPAGDNVLAPGWTDYSKRLLYQTYDVTDLLVEGENVIGAIVADGWACGFFGFDSKRPGAHYARDPQLLAQLVVRSADELLRVATDEAWTSSTGSIVHADLLMGERSDPAREPQGWDRPGFDDAAWRPAACRELGAGQLVADPGPPIVIAEEVPATSVRTAPGGEFIVDFGQNLAGWCRLWVDEPAGQLVRRPPRRSAGPGRGPLCRQPSHGTPNGHFHHVGWQGSLGAPLHAPRVSLRGYLGPLGPAGRGRCNGLRSPLRHAPHWDFRVFVTGHQ